MQRRTLLTFAGYTTAWGALGLLVPVGKAQAEVADLNDAINKAGRQRMLSQRMGKAWLALAHKADTPAARAVLEQSLALFERQLGELKAYAPSPAIRDTYVKLEGAWADHKATLMGTTPSRDGVAALLQADAKVLALAHQGTSQYEAALGIGSQPVRGMIIANDFLYVVHNATLYEINNAGTATPRGTLSTSSGRVEMAFNGFQVAIVDGANLYVLVLATMVTTGVSAASNALTFSSREGALPGRAVEPKAASLAWRSESLRTSSKYSASRGLEPGQPPST